jgi:hypothetical protein
MYTINNSSDHDTIQIHTLKHLLNKSLDWYNDIVLSILVFIVNDVLYIFADDLDIFPLIFTHDNNIYYYHILSTK